METSTPGTVLEVRHLTKLFLRPRTSLFRPPEHQVAVFDVSFSLPKGSVVGLIGETGSGKTTLGRMVMRLVEPTSGSIHFDGIDLTKMRGKLLRTLRKRFQMVFQDPYSSLNPRMTVRQTIEEPFLVHGVLPDKTERQKALESLLVKVGLDPGDLDRFPGEFSGGGRQRIGIARAIALSPDFLVADEPVSSLDVSIQAQIVNLFARLNKEDKMTFLFISHDLNVVSYLSDYVLVLYKGLNVESGPVQEVFNRPLHPYTRLLVSSSSEKERSAENPIPDISSGSGQAPPLCPFYDRCLEKVEACRTDPPPHRVSKEDGSALTGTPWAHRVSCHSPLGETFFLEQERSDQ
ncbi:Oligopeptide transport ATP-binding protein OppF [Leptospirillum ferriphilum]|jgi:oligopeptide/dipeptide ABC transporter ATP-binding protein|uniref:Oligopeptide transport ATP-binding protein OppF n=2 Tax=Leptospirillum TaxID=179 RepID=A0A094X8K9_9BACT|nr:ABC transporter ATP-binding protein [Leptospirillum ferriphilum]EDZ39738.1 MAG: ABC phosphate transporter [Leptospirillum sp. Group II '5-way CG']KGA94879.1 Oligopeptide transport ATP-binding protein OppF [Leptospirillum ferriphilum]MDA8150594.1 ABC transporter ATP-binding protein [Nitrospiraceae bacterium]